jgi:hypothetical protein
LSGVPLSLVEQDEVALLLVALFSSLDYRKTWRMAFNQDGLFNLELAGIATPPSRALP